MTPERIAELRKYAKEGLDASPWTTEECLDELRVKNARLAIAALHINQKWEALLADRDRIAAALGALVDQIDKEGPPAKEWEKITALAKCKSALVYSTALLAHDRELLAPVIELLEKWVSCYLIKGYQWKEASDLLSRLKARVEEKQ